MRRRAVPIILLCFVSITSFAHIRKKAPDKVDPAYSSALATANRFLNAWQMEDHETGIVMLTDSARGHVSSRQLQSFFSPGPQAAYEIAHGRRLRRGVYEFPVVLFHASETATRPDACTIIVTKQGRGDWAIDKLP